MQKTTTPTRKTEIFQFRLSRRIKLSWKRPRKLRASRSPVSYARMDWQLLNLKYTGWLLSQNCRMGRSKT